jgi:hypothetical protein
VTHTLANHFRVGHAPEVVRAVRAYVCEAEEIMGASNIISKYRLRTVVTVFWC